MITQEGALFSWRMFGIDVIVSPSFLLVMVMFVFLSGSLLAGLMMAAALAFVFITHELGHALTALSFGRQVPVINLNGMGGAAYVEERSDRHGQNILIGLAGPGVNLLTAGIIYLVGKTMDMGALPRLVGMFLESLYLYSLLLGVFNLLPAEPLDGGRILSNVLSGYTQVSRPQLVMSLVSLIMWGLLLAVGVYTNMFILMLIAGLMTFTSYQRYRALN